MKADLEQTARTLVSRGKGILAADETVPTLTKRFDALGIPSTPTTRRDYREMLLTAPGGTEFLSGVIMQDETIRQDSSDGSPLASVCRRLGILPGIKVDLGAKALAGWSDERVTAQHLNAINRAEGPKPWTLTFSYGRALQDAVLAAWGGKPENLAAGERQLYHRARCNSLAAVGAYTEAEEKQVRGEILAGVSGGWDDD